VDYLRGLKENVIMGRLIPAGTGLVMYRKLGIQAADDAQYVEDLPSDEKIDEKTLDIQSVN
jgi:DNA-directed RNA polymerase subunit beta'